MQGQQRHLRDGGSRRQSVKRAHARAAVDRKADPVLAIAGLQTEKNSPKRTAPDERPKTISPGRSVHRGRYVAELNDQ